MKPADLQTKQYIFVLQNELAYFKIVPEIGRVKKPLHISPISH
jgi:hypothetical protein